MSNAIKIKKNPYPISVLLIKAPGAPPVRGQILRLTEIGCMVRLKVENYFKVGDNHEIEFDVPTTHVTVHAPIKVIKTYDNFSNQGSQDKSNLEKVYMVEFHFRTLHDNHRQAIQNFVNKMGQN